jgi:membrane protein implicated in regulation of membrane protease activity
MTSANVLRVVATLRLWGWVGFWVQVVLSVISGIILLVFVGTRSLSAPSADASANPATLPGLGFAWLGLAFVGVSIFWHWRYTQWAKRLKQEDRPTKQQTLQQIKIGVVISLVGMLITLLGAGAIVGTLTAKSLQQQPNITTVSTLPVQPIDFFVIQANTNIILSHFFGLLTSLWLLQRVGERAS